MNGHETYMRRAIALARAAAGAGEVPVGAVIVADGEVVAEAANRVEADGDPTRHAEMIVLDEARGKLGTKWLIGATLYVTLEPCAMCAGAIVLSRLSSVVFGAPDPKGGAMGSLYEIGLDGRLNHTLECTGGILAGECGALLTGFFKERRGTR